MNLQVLSLRDASTGASARILVGLGFNCFSFQPVVGKQPIEVLWSTPEATAGTLKPSRFGIPILFPFGGRIRGTSFRYSGNTYPLEIGDDLGNAIHGFVLNRPWRVTEQTENSATGEFWASVDDPTLLQRWPADFRIRVSYCLSGTALASEITVDNPDQRPLPFGLGTHGYFRVPLGGASADECLLRVPVATRYELAGLVPTGKRMPAEFAPQLFAGMPFGETHFDDVFGGLKYDSGRCTASVSDPQSRRTLTLKFDEEFRYCVVFNPPHRQAICLEPYTTLPNPFELQQAGLEPHLRVLPPGQSFWTKIEIRLT